MKISVIFFGVLLAGCVSTPHISSLKPVETESYFVIDETVYDQVEKGAFGVKTIEGLKKGVYVAIGEDAEGTYYYGDNCYLFLQRKVDSLNYNGGVWVPNKGSTKKPYLFYINPDYSKSGTSLISSIIAKSEAGNIMPVLTPLNSKAASKISIVNSAPPENVVQGCSEKIDSSVWENWES